MTIRSVTLTVPNCEQDHILCYKAGLRPAHDNGPQLYYEIVYDSNLPYVIVHNYGHSGCGWTFAPGSAQLCCEHVMQACNEINEDLHSHTIAILGAGINGLMTAYHLAKKGFRVTIYSQEFSPHTTSDIAPALFTPPSISKTFDEKLLKRLLCESYQVYKELAESNNPEFNGVMFRDFYTYNDDAGMEIAVHYGLIPSGEPVDVYFSATSSPKRCMRYTTFFMDTNIIMKELMQKLRGFGVKMITKKIEDQQQVLQLGHRIIVNCLGLGASAVCHDSKLIPIQGQIVRLKAQPGLDYMFFAKNDDGSFTHWIPKQNYIFVGGSYMPELHSTEPDNAVCQKIIEKLQALTT